MAVQVAPRVLTQTPEASAAGAERRAGVEAEPAEPQDAGADHDERSGCADASASLAEPEALAEHDREGEARRTGVDVDGRATGEVVGAGAAEEEPVGLVGDPAARLGREAAEGEDPVGRGEVDERRPDRP